MDVATKANGLKIIWRGWVTTFGVMAAFIKASTEMTRSMGSVFTRGQMDAGIKATGLKDVSMVWGHISSQRRKN